MTIRYFHAVDECIRKCNQCLEMITLADHQSALAEARGQAIQDFIHGRTKLCLVCGGKEPCELKHDPHSPCTFEPTPMELMEEVKQLRKALAEKDAEIERLREWKKIVLGSGTDQEVIIRLAASEYTKIAAASWKRQYDALLAQAVRFAEWCWRSGINPGKRAEAKAFLDQHQKGASHA